MQHITEVKTDGTFCVLSITFRIQPNVFQTKRNILYNGRTKVLLTSGLCNGRQPSYNENTDIFQNYIMCSVSERLQTEIVGTDFQKCLAINHRKRVLLENVPSLKTESKWLETRVQKIVQHFKVLLIRTKYSFD